MLRRPLFVLALIAWLQPSFCMAQNPVPSPSLPPVSSPPPPAPVPVDVSSEAKRRAEEEARRKAMAEEIKRQSEKATKEKKQDDKGYTGAGAGSGSSGFQLLKIPVSGVYHLGMRKREYDSLVPQNPLFLTTEKDRYVLQPTPIYYYGRIYTLALSFPDTTFSSDLTDVTQYYQTKLGTPDEEKISDTSMVYPTKDEPLLQGTYQVKQASFTWHYKYHDVVIWYRLTDTKNGKWKGVYLIKYSGSPEYRDNLRRLDEKEKDKLGGY